MHVVSICLSTGDFCRVVFCVLPVSVTLPWSGVGVVVCRGGIVHRIVVAEAPEGG